MRLLSYSLTGLTFRNTSFFFQFIMRRSNIGRGRDLPSFEASGYLSQQFNIICEHCGMMVDATNHDCPVLRDRQARRALMEARWESWLQYEDAWEDAISPVETVNIEIENLNMFNSANDEKIESNPCVICLENKKCILIRPCFHVCMCKACFQRLTSTSNINVCCPKCRTKISCAAFVFC